METSKTIDLFGKEHHVFKKTPKKQKGLFDDYDGFVDKFKPKLTTDDCYTPPAVFDYIVDYVRRNCDIEGCTIVRPFYPGGDYENLVYPDNCVVVDNPPFSIVSKIARFYIQNNIRFFLFAPHLTLFNVVDCTRIVCGAKIIYKNGAEVPTSFISNMFGDLGIFGDHTLFDAIDRICAKPKANLPKYEYPPNVLTVSKIAHMVKNGQSFRAMKSDILRCPILDSQKNTGKTIFGSGFLCSEAAAAAAAAATAENTVIVWEISDREKTIIKSLG